jgi:hypothetical protein
MMHGGSLILLTKAASRTLLRCVPCALSSAILQALYQEALSKQGHAAGSSTAPAPTGAPPDWMPPGAGQGAATEAPAAGMQAALSTSHQLEVGVNGNYSGTALWQQQDHYIGEDDSAAGPSQSGGAGIAPAAARPGGAQSNAEAGALSHSAGPFEQWPSAEGATDGDCSSSGRPPPGWRSPGDKDSALERYRAGPGAPKARLLNDNHARMRAARRAARELAVALNALKRELDGAKEVAQAAAAARLALGGDEAQVDLQGTGSPDGSLPSTEHHTR